MKTQGGNRTKDVSSNLKKGDLQELPRVLPVERLLIDVRTLVKLTAPSTPPRVKFRAWDVLQALYLPGDASGAGFGSAIIK